MNVNGGAITVGHPLRMSDAGIALELRRRCGRTEVAALCGGGGQGGGIILTLTMHLNFGAELAKQANGGQLRSPTLPIPVHE
jgi:hypothetical protein